MARSAFEVLRFARVARPLHAPIATRMLPSCFSATSDPRGYWDGSWRPAPAWAASPPYHLSPNISNDMGMPRPALRFDWSGCPRVSALAAASNAENATANDSLPAVPLDLVWTPKRCRLTPLRPRALDARFNSERHGACDALRGQVSILLVGDSV
jgi:hypothetical protein